MSKNVWKFYRKYNKADSSIPGYDPASMTKSFVYDNEDEVDNVDLYTGAVRENDSDLVA